MNPYYSSTSKPKKQTTLFSSVSSTSDIISQTSPRDARKDLLALGIDIDESLIERMSRNLGVSTTFNLVAKASTIVRDRTKVDDNVDITYRNVTNPPEDAQGKPEKQTLSASQFQTSPQKVFQILRCLECRSGGLEPHVRATLSKLLAKFRISYNRNGELFIRRLLNLQRRNKKSNGTSTNTNHDPHLEILRSRYMDEHTFTGAILRLDKDTTQATASVLFSQLVERKAFGHALRAVVDLCLFLSLLSSQDVTRRSYDFSDSLVAHDVEFWNLNRAPNPNGGSNDPVVIPSSGVLSSAGALKRSQNLQTSLHPNPDPRNGRSISVNPQDQNAYNSEVSQEMLKSCSFDSVAGLLGKDIPQHQTGYNNGRQVVGTIKQESTGSHTKVATALNSPLRDLSHSERLDQMQQRGTNAVTPQQQQPFAISSQQSCESRNSQTLGRWLQRQFDEI